MYTGLGGWLLRLAAELAGPRGTPRELAGRRCRTPEDSRRTLAGTGAGLCRTSKDAPSCRGSSAPAPGRGSACGFVRLIASDGCWELVALRPTLRSGPGRLNRVVLL